MIYVIPDTHLGHENIKKYCNRPDNFEKLIETNWQSTVTDADTVIHLGDISFQENWVERLGGWHGKKILVRGNHDRLAQDFYLNCGFTLVVEELVLDVDNLIILFSHRPKFNHGCDINFHGHQHNLAVYDEKRLYLPLSIEHMGYKPLALDENFIDSLKKFVLKNKPPTLSEIMNLGQNFIGKPTAKDVYDGFGKEIFGQSRARLEECYKILNSPPYNFARYKFRLWRNAVRYIEGKISKPEFMNIIKKFL
ncbi:MAG: hypothetical protein IJT73_03110 [Selenomonadaceae bacterium]|nr:hypothetical protein [Selenomonadaceae bacterium]